jgi:hypothetical protein
MNEKATSRWLLWSGPLFAVLFLVGVFGIEGDEPPGEKASGAELVKFFDAHQGRGMISVFVTPLLAALLIMFAGAVRARAQRQETSSVGAAMMLGGALLWSAGMLVGSMLTLAQISSADHNQPQVAQTVNVIAAADWVPFIGGIAVFLIGAGLTVLGSRVLPVWLGWIALIVGIVSLAGPGGFVGFFVGPLWVLVAGIMLALRREDAPASRHVVTQPAPSVT